MPLRTDGAKLRELRELKGITATEFAQRAGYTLQHVSQVELGKANGGPRYVRAAVEILGCTIEEITDGLFQKRRPTERKAS